MKKKILAVILLAVAFGCFSVSAKQKGQIRNNEELIIDQGSGSETIISNDNVKVAGTLSLTEPPENYEPLSVATFDGNDEIDVGYIDGGPLYPLTLSVWAKFDNVSAQAVFVGLVYEVSTVEMIYIAHDSTGHFMAERRQTGAESWVKSPLTYDDNLWHFFEARYLNAERLELWVDNEMVAVDTRHRSIPYSATKMTIGYLDDATPNWWYTGELYGVHIDKYGDYLLHDGSGTSIEETNGGTPAVLTTADVPAFWANSTVPQYSPPDGVGNFDYNKRYLETANAATDYLPTLEYGSDDYWTLVIFPDTHWDTGDVAATERATAEWVTNNIVAENIQCVLHGGDVMNGGVGWTIQQHIDAWNFVEANIIDVIDAAGIPFMINVGNHDYFDGEAAVLAGTRNCLMADAGITKERLWNEPHFIGNFENENDSRDDLINLAYRYNIMGVDYLFLLLELHPRTNTCEWANEVIANHPNSTVILSTHSFLEDFGYPEIDPYMETFYELVVKTNPNANMLFFGHDHTSYRRKSEVINGQMKQYIQPHVPLWEGREADLGMPILLVRIYPDNRVVCRTYIPFTDTWLDDTDSFYMPQSADTQGITSSGREEAVSKGISPETLIFDIEFTENEDDWDGKSPNATTLIGGAYVSNGWLHIEAEGDGLEIASVAPEGDYTYYIKYMYETNSGYLNLSLGTHWSDSGGHSPQQGLTVINDDTFADFPGNLQISHFDGLVSDVTQICFNEPYLTNTVCYSVTDGTNINVFVNGMLKPLALIDYPVRNTDTDVLYLGRWRRGPAEWKEPYGLHVDRAIMFNRALSFEEMQLLYLGGKVEGMVRP